MFLLIRILSATLVLILFLFIGASNQNNFEYDKSIFLCGDVNLNGTVNILDVTYTISYLYKNGPEPYLPLLADVNSSEDVNILDVTAMISYLYKGGPDLNCPVDPDAPPTNFDLRTSGEENYVTVVKNQYGGTCWTHGVMASMESNMLRSGYWDIYGDTIEPDLSEYHLDWWNGFNQNNNDDLDPPDGQGLIVHEGGDYMVATAYMSRGEGMISEFNPYVWYQPHPDYLNPPDRICSNYDYYYSRDVEWFTIGENLRDIDILKQRIMDEGAVGTALCYSSQYIDESYAHYQPPSSSDEPNHAVTIVGWSDTRVTEADKPGAWLIKNSWGPNWANNGYFWISYYDKHSGHHPEMGFVSFINTERMRYDKIYYHDYHGWRETKSDCNEAFNKFITDVNGTLEAVNFFVADNNVDYEVTIYDDFNGSELSNPLAVLTGTITHKGFHTLDLTTPIEYGYGEDFYVYLNLSTGGQPYDCSSDIPVLLGSDQKTWVESYAEPGQSYFRENAAWKDLNSFNNSANFCIKALSLVKNIKLAPYNSFISEGPSGGPFEPATQTYFLTHKYNTSIEYTVTLDGTSDWLDLTGDLSGTLTPGDTAVIEVNINSSANTLCEGIHHASISYSNLTHPEDFGSRDIELIIGSASLQHSWYLDSDPGWTCEGDWAYGTPTGGGGFFGFGADPVGGYTGDYVYGYNIDGNYVSPMPEYSVTSSAIDCEHLFDVSVKYQSWLASDGYCMGTFSVSTDGSNWHNLWHGYEGTDITWTEREFDISEYADFTSTLFLRWTTYSESGANHTFGGWNIDDIELWGVFDSVAVGGK